jgi:hypothetical protein
MEIKEVRECIDIVNKAAGTHMRYIPQHMIKGVMALYYMRLTVPMLAILDDNRLICNDLQLSDWDSREECIASIAHEAGHIVSGHFKSPSRTAEGRKAQEIEADVFAHKICKALGLDLYKCALTYAKWLGRQELFDEVNYPTLQQRVNILVGGAL